MQACLCLRWHCWRAPLRRPIHNRRIRTTTGGARPPWLLPGWALPAAPQPTDEDQPVDFGVLRPYLDRASIGEPCEHGILSRKSFEQALTVAKNHAVPHVQAIPPGGLPKDLSERPLAAWLKASVKQLWGWLLTQTVDTGDYLNRLSNAAEPVDVCRACCNPL